MEPVAATELDNTAVASSPAQLSLSPLLPVIPEFPAYKATRLSDIVCRRNVRLYKDRVQTIHPQSADLGSEKTWFLDRTCKLEPEYVDELVAEKRTVRPPGQWTVTAKLTTVTGQAQEPVDLYCVTIHWPTSWLATKGYTSFTLGFETVEEAAQWHALVQRQLSALRVRAVSSKGDSSAGHSSKPSYDEGLGARGGGSGNGAVARKTSQGFVAAALEHFWSSGSGTKDDKQLHALLDCDQSVAMRPGLRQGITSPISDSQEPINCPDVTNQQLPACYPGAQLCQGAPILQGQHDSFTSSSTEGCDGTAQLLQQPHRSGAHQEEERWVPYRHTNGVAIYHHKEPAATCSMWDCGQDDGDGGPAGSEYMASSIVRGCPFECLSVLVNRRSNTTILGPASKIELLEEGDERQVLRLTVEATGIARRLCAPREVIVERLFKREECGVDVILFSSCDEPQPTHTVSGTKRHRPTAASAFAGSSLAGRSSAAGGSGKCNGNTFDSSRQQNRLVSTPAAAVAAVAVAVIAAAAAGSWFSCVMLLLVAALLELRFMRLAGSGSKFQSLWYKPVRAYVQGGYTISPREDCNAVNSPECLVTCILKVDLRGFLGERSWLRPILDALGWVDAYVERMLMAVILVKDEVEQQRFLVQPFSILTNNHAARASSSMVTATSAGGSSADMDDSLTAATLRDGYSQHLRQQHLMRQRRRQLQVQQQQQQAYMRHNAGLSGYPQDEAARLAAHGYWGSGITSSSQPNMLRAGLGVYYPQAGLLGRDYPLEWPYKGPLLGLGRSGGDAYGRQQQELLMQGADGGTQHKRGNGQQGRQQGRLGRMASRIYALRPRLRKGDTAVDRAVSAPAASGGAAAANGQPAGVAAGLYTQLSVSFKSSLAALSASSDSAVAAGAASAAAPPGDAAEASGASDGASTAAAAAAAQAAGADAAGSAAEPVGLSDTAAVLASLGMPADTAVVGPQYYIGGPQGPAAKYSSLNPRYWSELHVPGTPAPFKLRGASYLADRTKVDGGMPQFVLGSVDLVETAGPTQHISRFLPAVRCNEAAYSFVVNLIIPGTPVLSLVAVFINEHHPDILDGPSCSSSAPHHSTSKSSPALAEQLHQEQQSSLRRLSSSSTNLLRSSLQGSSQLDVCKSNTVCAGATGTGAAMRADVDGDTDSHSRYETPVGGRPVDAASEDSSEGLPNVVGIGADTCDDGVEDSAPPGEGEDIGPMYDRPRDVNDWQPFDFALHRFLHGGPQTRQAMFKLIPHIAEGSWVIKQSVGTVPVILGNKLQTVYYQTDRYIEATVDVTSSSAAAYITSMVRGATKSLVIDLGFVLEGQRPEELPEALLGAFRLNHLDCSQAQRIDTTHELPLRPRPLQQHQLTLLPPAAAGKPGSQAGAAVQGVAVEPPAAVDPGLGSCWQADSQRRACSASGAMSGAAAAAAAADSTAQQQQQQQEQQQPPLIEQLGQHRGSSGRASARNSSSVLDSGRTMTGHARSRSAASAEELYHTHGLLLTAAVQQGREQRPGSTQHAQPVQQQPQQQSDPADEKLTGSIGAPLSSSAAAAGEAGGASGMCSSCPGPPSIRTRTAPAAADATRLPAAEDGCSAEAAVATAGVVPSTARQLFGSLLPFGSSPGANNQQDKMLSGGKGGAAANHTSSSLYACGAVTTLSTASTPTAAAAAAASSILSSPRNASAAAAAGGAGGLLVGAATAAVPGAGNGSQHYQRSSMTMPMAAGAATSAVAGSVVDTPSSSAGQLRTGHHQRTSSGTSDAASRTPAQVWPSSPPASGQELSASKLSAAAFISRAHAAALAASAQRRGQRGPLTQSAGPSGSPAGLSSLGSPGGLGSYGGEQPHSGSPGSGPLMSTPVTSGTGSGVGFSDAAGVAAAAGSWQSKRQRASSTGVADIGAGPALEHCASLPAQPEAAVANCAKISATEQLRLTHHALRASATGGGGAGSGSHGVLSQAAGISSLCRSSSGVLAGTGRQSSASGGPVVLSAAGPAAATAAVAADGSSGQGKGAVVHSGTEQGVGLAQQLLNQQTLPAKRRTPNHRRFASMGAVHY